ncbi:thioester reductase domain-containing protein [Actinocorallia libanotica]|uniref:Thioester reductase domain-containing protein n=1 Tax=Actinocorallia libanotica TaxID=46162 RepID=A0ABP4AXF0_9ACTN
MLIPRRPAGTAAPLTPAQARLWFLEQAGFSSSGSGSAYLCWSGRRYRGPLDAGRLRAALRETAARHEALRTWIGAGPDGPVQHVVAEAPDVLDARDVSGAADPVAEARRVSEEFVARPLRLDRPPLHRALLLRLGEDDHVLVWCLHHIICDGRSLGLLEAELSARYRGEAPQGEPVQFPDYAAWAAGRETGGREHWAERLAGAPAVQGPPSDLPRPAEPGVRGAHCAARLDPGLSRDLLDLARRERCTPFTVFLTAMMIALSRHSGERDVVIGTPSSERDAPGLEDAVGFYVNTLPIRCAVSEDRTFREQLREVRAVVLDALAHRDVPFEEIVAACGAAREPGRNPLFQTMLVMEQGGPDPAPEGTVPQPWPLVAPTSRLDLTMLVSPGGPGIDLYFDYAAELLTETEAARFRDQIVRLLRACVADPAAPIRRTPALTAAEHARLLDVPADASQVPDVVEGFLAVADRQPDAPALIAAGRTLTYRELERESRLLGARLADTRLVGIVLPQGPDAIIAILAALRAGAAYLPLSPDDPRAPALLRRSGADAVIDADGIRRLPGGGAPPDGLAYVIFTSGSTGEPKGVMVGRRGLARFTRSFVEAHTCFAPGQRVLMLPPLTFDASIGDLFPALTSGAALVLHPEPARLDAAGLVAFCSAHSVTAVDAPVALWRGWTDDLAAGTVRVPPEWPVTTLMVGGDRVPTPAVAAWAKATGSRVRFHDHYGPTEATVCATLSTTVDAAEYTATGGRRVAHLPIGRPLPHVRAHVLTPEGELAAPGAPGELYLAGECVALGYLGAPELTAERFVPDPWSGGRMYRTGDLARWRTDGLLEFLGRADRQVKIRGFRVEPGEVESALTAHPKVHDAAVIAAEGRLVAYTATKVLPGELRSFVREKLPRALMPDVFVPVGSVPRTPHGKVDLAALPPVPAAENGYAPPEGPLEGALAAIWAKVLEVPRVGRTDNFFALGGSSIIATRIAAAVERALGARMPLEDLLASDDLADLARRLGETNTPTPVPSPAAEPPDLREPLPPEIRAAGRVPSEPPRTVLLTGATGFLGAHLLAELLARPETAVLCLVRADGAAQGHARVREALRSWDLDGDPGRIVALPGDLALPRFGLDEAQWRDLARRCDAICHNGGLVSFTEPYERLRPPNVGGTVEALRLAALGGGTPVHAVSTLGVYIADRFLGARVTEQDAPDDPAGLPGPYEQSKWAADRLCREARAAGILVSLHRPARIGGHSLTGRADPGDYFSSLLRTFAQTGCVPDLAHTEDVTPVDHVAAAITRAVMDPDATGRDHHYFNNATIGYPELAEALRSHGRDAALVPWERWRDEVNARLAAGTGLALAPFVTSLPETAPDFPRPEFDCARTERDLGACPPADRTLIGRYLDFLASAGALA